MASSLFTDPLQMWRDVLTNLETEVNSIATGSTKSKEVVRSLHQFSATALGFQRILEKTISAYLRRANLPSRQEVVELGESLRRIESKLDQLLPVEVSAPALPRPARTRRPQPSATVPAPEVLSAPAAQPARQTVAKRKDKSTGDVAVNETAARRPAVRRGRS